MAPQTMLSPPRIRNEDAQVAVRGERIDQSVEDFGTHPRHVREGNERTVHVVSERSDPGPDRAGDPLGIARVVNELDIAAL